MPVPCPYCEHTSELARRYGDGPMTECAACGAWFMWPRPTRESMIAHYNENRAGMPRELRAWREGTSQSGWYELLARKMARRVNDPASIVDIGAGGLELTQSLARVFPRAPVEAWDLFADGVPTGLPDRITPRRVDLNDLPVSDASFDVVACVAVIEHVIEPLSLLRFLRSITRRGGFAYVVGPEVRAVAHRLLRKSWPYYCPDEHLTLPTLTSIEKAVALAGGGHYELRKVNVHYSLKYLLRFLRVPIPVPASMDLLLPVPAGAFELVWFR